MPIEHGLELIKSFLDDRNERELKMVYFLAQPNGFNREQGLSEFLRNAKKGAAPPKTEAEIMDGVKNVLSLFERRKAGGNI